MWVSTAKRSRSSGFPAAIDRTASAEPRYRGAAYGAPRSLPATQSSVPAQSRTLSATTCSVASPPQASPTSGPPGISPRDGFRPTSPQHEAGIRIDPAPSLACAIGTIRAATAAPAPPLDPPALCSGFQGLRVGPP